MNRLREDFPTPGLPDIPKTTLDFEDANNASRRASASAFE